MNNLLGNLWISCFKEIQPFGFEKIVELVFRYFED